MENPDGSSGRMHQSASQSRKFVIRHGDTPSVTPLFFYRFFSRATLSLGLADRADLLRWICHQAEPKPLPLRERVGHIRLHLSGSDEQMAGILKGVVPVGSYWQTARE